MFSSRIRPFSPRRCSHHPVGGFWVAVQRSPVDSNGNLIYRGTIMASRKMRLDNAVILPDQFMQKLGSEPTRPPAFFIRWSMPVPSPPPTGSSSRYTFFMRWNKVVMRSPLRRSLLFAGTLRMIRMCFHIARGKHCAEVLHHPSQVYASRCDKCV